MVYRDIICGNEKGGLLKSTPLRNNFGVNPPRLISKTSNPMELEGKPEDRGDLPPDIEYEVMLETEAQQGDDNAREELERYRKEKSADRVKNIYPEMFRGVYHEGCSNDLIDDLPF